VPWHGEGQERLGRPHLNVDVVIHCTKTGHQALVNALERDIRFRPHVEANTRAARHTDARITAAIGM
jgi:hypothetical protein